MTAVEEETTVEESGIEPHPDVIEKIDDSDIVKALKSAGHRTVEHPNGLVLGIRLSGVPGTRGVHVDVVHVLDLRKARFGRSNLAVQSALLEVVNRPLENLLRDVEMDGMLGVKSLLAPLGRMELNVLQSPTSDSTSLIHETRTVYAVFAEGTSHRNLSWLTAPSRIIPDNELALLLSSDARSNLHEVQKSVDADKWDDLEGGFQRAWFGLLPVLMGVIAGFGILGALMGGGTLLIPLIVCAVTVPLGLWMLRGAGAAIHHFQESLETELVTLSKVADAERIKSAIDENMSHLELVGTLNFIVTTLMDSSAVAIEELDVDGSVIPLSFILDECVRLAPISSEEGSKLSGDPGMEKFIGLFKNLGLEFQEGEEEALELAYVALTGHSSSPLNEHEVIRHLGVLNNILFDVGALSPEVKNRIDDMMNFRVRDVMVEEFGKELAKPEELITESEPEGEAEPADNLGEVLQVINESNKTEDEPEIEMDEAEVEPLLEEPEPEIIEPESIKEKVESEEPPVLVAETVVDEPEEVVQTTLEPEPETGEEVIEQVKGRRRRGVTDPLSHIRASGRKKERGVAGA